MDMSPACSPPTQPSVTQAEQAHPRFREYEAYRLAMNRQMVTGCSFKLWLEGTLRRENGYQVVYSVSPGEYPTTCERGRMAPGWYKDKVGPWDGRREPRTVCGPFNTQSEAEAT